ncbi:MAG: phosphoribosylformylglycinamidine synthase, partial [Neisseriaceae bacterium]
EYTVNDKPNHIKSALDIMIEAPIGGASFNNEFGRPNLGGYFRSFEQQVNNKHYAYHKPIMIAGGFGNINVNNLQKKEVIDNALIIQLGGPGFLIGLGGGSASSMASGTNLEELDFNSVQRSNPEMERRCQEVIDTCSSLNENNPILSIHDIGAGGLSNAVPELIHASNKGGKFELRNIPIYDTSMSPLEIWCNESQERYVLAISSDKLDTFATICKRENCPFAVLGHATYAKQLVINDDKYNNKPIDIDIDILLGKPPKTIKTVDYNTNIINSVLDVNTIDFSEAAYKVISHPTVSNKSFLITIGDRSVGGMTVRDQMVGRWQIPISDCAITLLGYNEYAGEVASMGERTPVAILNPEASCRMAVAESITNISSAYINKINDIKLSANWMASCGSENQDAMLYKAVEATSLLCQQLNIAIPVGKDSLSMKMQWDNKQVISPVSLIISAFATTSDVRQHKTPVLLDYNSSKLILLSLNEKQRLGGSILQECYSSFGGETSDVDEPSTLANLFNLIQKLHKENIILAYHDRSDGGLFATLCEMIFASRIGIELYINEKCNVNQFMFNEEIGVVLQIDDNHVDELIILAKTHNIHYEILGNININNDNFNINQGQNLVFNDTRENLQKAWSQISHKIQRLRDNPECADSELNVILDKNNKGLFSKPNFNINKLTPPNINSSKPRIAILREQGVNGHIEMAAAFTSAGFDAYDVHINDILSGKFTLTEFQAIAACGGFSYGDVLGAGTGWAKSILFNSKLKDEFSHFFNRSDTFALGVCNGCQMMAQLKDIIPHAENYPIFTKNKSQQFEARLCMVEINNSPSILFKNMQGSQLPIVVSHGEGYASFGNITIDNSLVAMRYIDNNGVTSETYPYNPNGSSNGITAITNKDGRFTIMMPHPERIVRTTQMSWHDKSFGRYSPWFKMFLNAREFVDNV